MKTIFIGQTDSTPLGNLWVAQSQNGLIAVVFPSSLAEFTAIQQKRHGAAVEFAPEKVKDSISQLQEYAIGTRKTFDLPIDWLIMNEFQRKALYATYQIPYGETRTYKQIAIEIGAPRGARAVGRAEATNPMPIVLPCHRVIGSDGKLHGYGAGDGLNTKTWLLNLERALLP